MLKIKFKNLLNFIIYPLLLASINFILISFIMNYYISDLDINMSSILTDDAPNFEANIESIFTKPSVIENGTVTKNNIEFPKVNTEYGKFEIESAKISSPLIFGDGYESLKMGVGQYSGSYIPGYGGTILVTGHNYMFPQIENAKLNDIIKITTSYGVYKYKISSIKILEKEEYSSFSVNNNKEQLVFYTCYPFNSLGSISTRYFIYADYLSGPKVVE